ncbi:MAG TPA: FAD-dependent oxidoreductase [Candidatus Limnocylindria bacterium]|nr:FAD-dependent oxidoreductase [Candidatus Limnocylindria bacterium]
MDRPADAAVPHVRCCIVGGGPAGIMLGFLLARAGIEVVVLEKHADFFRDFRGDTIHPSTLEVIRELGLLDAFLRLPHQEIRALAGQIGDVFLPLVDFTRLPTHCKFLAFMPQWDFLNFLAEQGRRYPGFRLQVETDVDELIVEGERVVGVRARTPHGSYEVRADLIVAADGRNSTVRARAGLEVVELGAPIDVLWFRIARYPSDPRQVAGRADAGRIMVMLDRGDYWQCGFVIPKGAFERMQRQGIGAFRDAVATLAPFLRDRTGELAGWDAIRLLTVRVDRLRRWYRAGLLCIGDAAHAMSPIGGVGINLAIQDAVAAANVLVDPLRRGAVDVAQLARVQRRRQLPTSLTQAFQLAIQNRVIRRVLGETRPLKPPLILRVFAWWPALRRIPGRLIGIGVRPEHVRTPDAGARAAS